MGSLGLLLGGLGCTYTVRVENRSRQAVTVRLVQTDPLVPDWILAAARIEAGRDVRLGPSRVAFSDVVLEAEQPDRAELPSRIDIDSGGSTIQVVTESKDGRDRVVLKKVATP